MTTHGGIILAFIIIIVIVMVLVLVLVQQYAVKVAYPSIRFIAKRLFPRWSQPMNDSMVLMQHKLMTRLASALARDP